MRLWLALLIALLSACTLADKRITGFDTLTSKLCSTGVQTVSYQVQTQGALQGWTVTAFTDAGKLLGTKTVKVASDGLQPISATYQDSLSVDTTNLNSQAIVPTPLPRWRLELTATPTGELLTTPYKPIEVCG